MKTRITNHKLANIGLLLMFLNVLTLNSTPLAIAIALPLTAILTQESRSIYRTYKKEMAKL
ncbi:hypothetical protein CIP107578_00704 [Corynebacterium diphtheriae]|uniref:Uncharacterized protein n=1 Tax=Corynebacterium diphtheriae TaxID=1717 RepID=A0A811G2I8_CORDP|nr:hypothetical protein BHU48_03350 [Corynebacterium diphtheriae]OWM96901.1 hypothetical protein AY481_04400 [Corynebacterium diphtheriae bv. mitis]OWO45842.1 hypothetical protein AY545_03410 [Corynebacterium belfantii]OMO44587.1 hypothetical protein BVL41_03755 [Corynebacterium diphtheriae]OMO48334.1 hypothetical protein BVL40_05160 [Corynebacterium diphtheriae]